MRSESPVISVILPVYNAEKYLREAVDSILQQSFGDFELLLVNDGSSDGSEAIIRSYTDPRIVYIKNPKNLGLISTLNKVVQSARGQWVARMDSDDISLPQRFELQLNYAKQYPAAGLVCSPIVMMTADGKTGDHWPADMAAKTPEQIVRTLPRENCIAHPTVLVKTELLRKYPFAHNQKGSEDWDLWLRFARDKVLMVKTPEVLLRYRVHSASVTQVFNAGMSPQIKSALVKWKFAWNSLKHAKLNSFVLRTLFSTYKDLGYHVKSRVLPKLLRQAKWLFSINPFTAWAQYRALCAALKKGRSRYFLFFPYYHIGGAEKVHAQITRVIEDQQPFVFFTGLDNLASHQDQYGSNAVVLPVAQALYHPFFSKRSAKRIFEKISATKNAYVFGCNSLFFYDLALKLGKDITVADLTHDYDYVSGKAFAQKYLGAFLRMNTRVFISNRAVEKLRQFYEANSVDARYNDRIQLIYNYTDKPVAPIDRSWQTPYRVLYVGRDTAEKRVEIIFRLAELCQQAELPLEFMLVGHIKQQPKAGQKNITLKGAVLDPQVLSAIYAGSHVVMISSSSEGFPLSLAEGMAHGCIPVSTAVGDIPFHISPGKNGFLIPSKPDAGQVAAAFLDLFKQLMANEQELKAVSENAAAYAAAMFDKDRFVREYRQVFGLI